MAAAAFTFVMSSKPCLRMGSASHTPKGACWVHRFAAPVPSRHPTEKAAVLLANEVAARGDRQAEETAWPVDTPKQGHCSDAACTPALSLINSRSHETLGGPHIPLSNNDVRFLDAQNAPGDERSIADLHPTRTAIRQQPKRAQVAAIS
jgi:hypothetical protein